MFYLKIFFVSLLIRGQLCSPTTPGSWHECSGNYFFLSTQNVSNSETFTFCSQLFKKTYLAKFGSNPVAVAESIIEKCKLPLVDTRHYWIECKNGQKQTECTTLTKRGGHILIDSVSCLSLAYPICKTENSSVTSTISSSPVASTSINSPVSFSTRNSPVASSTRNSSVASTTKNTPVPPTTRNSPVRSATPFVTSAVTLPPDTPSPSFPSRCASDQGWYNIKQHSYCVTNHRYNFTEAWEACQTVNGSLADLHSVSRDTLNNIIRGLGLRWTSFLKAWIKGIGKERVLYLNSLARQYFLIQTTISEFRAFCERPMNSSVTSPPPPRSMLPVTDLPSASTPMFANSSTKSSVSTSQSMTKIARIKTTANNLITMNSTSTTHALSLIKSSSGMTSIWTTTVPNRTEREKNPSWERIIDQEYFISKEWQNYTFSMEICKKVNATLVAFLNSIRYFQVLAKLNLDYGSYWVGAHENRNHLTTDECVSYHVQTNTLSTSKCARKLYSVCSRPVYNANATEITENPVFKKLLKDMTVEKSETSINRRKLVSVNDDKRKSAKAIGSLSAFVLCFLVGLLLLADLSKFVFVNC